MPKPCKFPSPDSCQMRFLWTHKESDLAPHLVVGLELHVGNAEKIPQALGFESPDPFCLELASRAHVSTATERGHLSLLFSTKVTMVYEHCLWTWPPKTDETLQWLTLLLTGHGGGRVKRYTHTCAHARTHTHTHTHTLSLKAVFQSICSPFS